ncbi:MAG: hypothetical protein ACRETQ_08535 [Gammaproteobacteria bacterium]
MSRQRFRVGWLLLAGALCLTGCGSGARGVSGNPDPGGIYSGTFTDAHGARSQVVGIVTANGRAVIFDAGTGTQVAGRFAVRGDRIAGIFTAYPPAGAQFAGGKPLVSLKLAGTLEPGRTLSGTYTGAGEQGRFALTDDGVSYDRGSALALLAGGWGGMLPDGATITLNVRADGLLSGVSADLCSYTGRFGMLDAQFNVYTLELTATCPHASYTVSGLATIGKSRVVDKPEVFYAVANPELGLAGSLTQQ